MFRWAPRCRRKYGSRYTQDPQEWELHDLASDPSETNNLYGKPEHAAVQRQLKQRLDELLREIPVRRSA